MSCSLSSMAGGEPFGSTSDAVGVGLASGALTNMGTVDQKTATLGDIVRHTREGLNFKRRAAEAGWKEEPEGSFEWPR